VWWLGAGGRGLELLNPRLQASKGGTTGARAGMAVDPGRTRPRKSRLGTPRPPWARSAVTPGRTEHPKARGAGHAGRRPHQGTQNHAVRRPWSARDGGPVETPTRGLSILSNYGAGSRSRPTRLGPQEVARCTGIAPSRVSGVLSGVTVMPRPEADTATSRWGRTCRIRTQKPWVFLAARTASKPGAS
jgi:hypothetical protein